MAFGELGSWRLCPAEAGLLTELWVVMESMAPRLGRVLLCDKIQPALESWVLLQAKSLSLTL